MSKVCYWDEVTRTQKERDMTPEEEAQRQADIAAASIPTVAQYTAAIQAMLDDKAKERGYDNILSACTYATSTVPKFQAEGQACVNWRDAVWSGAYLLAASVENGNMQPPAIPALLSMLPTMEWPQ